MKINSGGTVPPHFIALRLVLSSILFVVYSFMSCAYAQQWDWAVYGELNNSFYDSKNSTYFDSIGNSYTVVYTGEESVNVVHTDGCELDIYPSLGIDDLFRSYWQLVKRDIAGHEVWRSSKQLTSAIDDIMFQDSRILVSAYHYLGDIYYELNGVRYSSTLTDIRLNQKIVLEFDNLGNLVSHYPLHASSKSKDVLPINDDFLVLHFNKDSGRIVLPDTTVVSSKPLDYYGLHRVDRSGNVKWSKYFNWPFIAPGYYKPNQRVASGKFIYYIHRVTSATRLYKMDLDGNLLDSVDIDANAERVVADSKGNIIVTGNFWGDFNFQRQNISDANTASPFILKLTDDLNYLWHYNLAENDSNSRIEYIKVNADNQIMASIFYENFNTLEGKVVPSQQYIFVQLEEDGSYIDHQVLDVAVGNFQPLHVSDFAFVNNKDIYIAYDREIPISSGLSSTNIANGNSVIAKLNYQEFELTHKEISCKNDSLALAADSAFIKLEWLVNDKMYLGKKIRPVVDSSGLYPVQINAYINDSVFRKICDTVRIRVVPIANFNVSDTVVCAFQPISFIDESISQDTHSTNGQRWVWTFGDGETKTVLSPESKSPVSHVYKTPGTYTVSLFYSNGYCDSTLTKNQYIKVVDAPAPGFSIDNNRGCSPFRVNITDTVTKNTVRKEYNYYDGRGWVDVPVNQTNFSQTYPDAGAYWITQRLYGYTGCVTQLDSVRIYVTPGLTAQDSMHVTHGTYPLHPSALGALVIHSDGRQEWRGDRENIKLTWSTHPAAVEYKLSRNGTAIAQIDATTTTFYRDSLERPNYYTYEIIGIDSCGTASSSGRTVSPIYLTGQASENNELAVIQFSPYTESLYELNYEVLTEENGVWYEINPLAELGIQTSYQDDEFLTLALQSDPVTPQSNIALEKCYIIRNQYGDVYSNVLCLPYKPTVFIPTAFTPNGDNLNDVYRPVTFGIEQYQMRIYNRYGQLIADHDQTSSGWDAADAPMGAYMVTVRAKGTDNRWYNLKQTVTVVR